MNVLKGELPYKNLSLISMKKSTQDLFDNNQLFSLITFLKSFK